MKKNKGILLALAAAALLGLSGCQEGQEEQPTELLLMNGWGGTGADHVAMRDIYTGFMEENPDIRLILDSSPDISITIDKGEEMLAVDRMPDILSTNGYEDFVKYAVGKGYALDLIPYLEKEEGLSECIPASVLESQMEDGALYTVPDVVELSGYWYNKEIFRQAGIEKNPETWEEFWAMCQQLQNWSEQEQNQVVPVVMEAGQAAFAFTGARIAGEGREGLKMLEKKPENFQHPAIEAALKDLIRIYEYSGNMSTSLNENDALDAFNKGKAAMYFNGAWANVMISSKIPAGFSNYPEGVCLETITSGYVLSNTQGEKKTEAAIRFLKYILSEEVQRRILRETKQVPVNQNISYLDFKKELPLLIEAVETSKKAEIKVQSLRSAWGAEIVDWMQEHIGSLLDGSVTVEEYLQLLNQAAGVSAP